jgi:hypothetical protein
MSAFLQIYILFNDFKSQYRLVGKYMCHPLLIKLNMSDIDENYFLSEVVSIALPQLTS